MSDGLIIIALAVLMALLVIFWIVREPIGDAIRTGGFKLGAELLKGKLWTEVPAGEKKQLVEKELKVELDNTVPWRKEKVADIYWLGSDIMSTIGISLGGSPTDIIWGLQQCWHHSRELELDKVIEDRFLRLWDFAKALPAPSWTEPNRMHIARELSAMIHAVALIIEAGDPNFRDKPQVASVE